MKEICANCNNWRIDPDALPEKLREIVKKRVPGETDPLTRSYGTCVAEYTDSEGSLRYYFAGSLGGRECFAIDDLGIPLFTPVLED